LVDYTLLGSYELDLERWRYDTFLVSLPTMTPFRPGNAESEDVRWVAVEEAESLPLMHAFRSSWQWVREDLRQVSVSGTGTSAFGRSLNPSSLCAPSVRQVTVSLLWCKSCTAPDVSDASTYY